MPEPALHLYRAPVGVHNLLADGQPKPTPSFLPGTFLGNPIEALEDMGQIFWRNANARIHHTDTHGALLELSRHRDPPMRGRVA